MYPTMYDSVSPPLAGGPAQDLGGAKQDPKANRDTAIVVDPNKKLFDALGNHEYDHEVAPRLNPREENENSTEPINKEVQTTCSPKNFENSSISNSLNNLNSLLKQVNNPLQNPRALNKFVSISTSEDLFAFFQFYIFKNLMQIEALKSYLLVFLSKFKLIM
jgi:hypothetical protein